MNNWKCSSFNKNQKRGERKFWHEFLMYCEHWGFHLLSTYWSLTCCEHWASKASSVAHCRSIWWLLDYQVVFHREWFNSPLSEVSRDVFQCPTWSIFSDLHSAGKMTTKKLSYKIVNLKLPVTKWKSSDCNNHEKEEDNIYILKLQKLGGGGLWWLVSMALCNKSCSASAFMDSQFCPSHWTQFCTVEAERRLASLTLTLLHKGFSGWWKSNSWQQQKAVLLNHKL